MRIAATILCLGVTLGCAEQRLDLSVLSGPSDMVTGGDALVEVTGASAGSLQVELDGRDVTSSFRSDSDPSRLVGRLSELKIGKNTVTAMAGERSASLELINHPRTGPVFSGPHQEPFVCQTEQAGLGPPSDANCSAQTRSAYYYRSTDRIDPQQRRARTARIPPGFKPLDPSAPRPSDIARTTTTEGHEQDFIIRVESGTINRAIYEIAFLHDPADGLPDPWSIAPGWNGRLVYRFGGGCRAGYRQGLIRSALQDQTSLGNGYAVAVSSQNVFGNNCNDVISAETAMMVKEHFIESFGVPVHTIGVGGSGGSMQQHLIAQNYPGLLDGIIPGASYPDTVTLAPPVTDCSLLARAIDSSAHDWSEDQKKAVSGFATWATCESWMRSYSPALIQPGSCHEVVPEELVYHPVQRPDGVRCGFHDNLANLVGRDSATGLPRRALDNVGVQYGLQAFNDGVIDAERFIELNESIGGFDDDANIVSERSAADADSLTILYETGRVNSGGGSLGAIPIIDTRRYSDPSGNIHDRVRTFVMGARLQREHGSAANHVILTNPPPQLDVVRLMDKWLDSVAADESGDGPVDAISRGRPGDLSDACWSAEGERLADDAASGGSGPCSELYPPSGDPRIAAGAPLEGDILKCQLKPLDPTDYGPSLTSEQLSRLSAVFPGGVCDYSKPGIGQVPLERTWIRY
ncbi:MAG: hypothetical protein F4X12_17045 [Acidobacteriia bacterium]|nr:hypothetical protein [Terriglobia bacterium]